jgi:hypothetical protein
MEETKELFAWLAMAGGFANAVSFVPQMQRMRHTGSSRDLSLTTVSMWLVILLVSVIHLFLQRDFLYGSGLAASWIMCCLLFGQALYYRYRVVATPPD